MTAASWGARVRRWPARALVFAIGVYRNMISPLRPPSCRFVPTCSEYAVDAVTEYGLLRGSWLTLVRLAKCGPWHRGGWDPIPERPAAHSSQADTAGSSVEPMKSQGRSAHV